MTRDPSRGSEPFNLRYWWWGFLASLEYAWLGVMEKQPLSVIWCRFNGHPNGPRWSADQSHGEPDYRCVDCDEYLN